MANRKQGDYRQGGSFLCPHCGAEVPADAAFCRACGASDDSGWDDSAWTEDEDADDFEYDEYLAREFPESAPPRLAPLKQRIFALVAVLLCLAILLWALLGG